jgi:hypothetical protein
MKYRQGLENVILQGGFETYQYINRKQIKVELKIVVELITLKIEL